MAQGGPRWPPGPRWLEVSQGGPRLDTTCEPQAWHNHYDYGTKASHLWPISMPMDTHHTSGSTASHAWPKHEWSRVAPKVAPRWPKNLAMSTRRTPCRDNPPAHMPHRIQSLPSLDVLQKLAKTSRHEVVSKNPRTHKHAVSSHKDNQPTRHQPNNWFLFMENKGCVPYARFKRPLSTWPQIL